MRGISWLAAKPVSFSRRTLLHGVSKWANSVRWSSPNFFALPILSNDNRWTLLCSRIQRSVVWPNSTDFWINKLPLSSGPQMVDGGFSGYLWTQCISTEHHGVTDQGSHQWQNLNSRPGKGIMLPATQSFAAHRDVRNDKTSFNPVVCKADRKYRSNFKKLWAVSLGRNILHINSFCKNVLKIATTWLMLWTAIFINCPCYCKYIFIVREIPRHTGKFYVCLFILQSAY